MKINGKLDDKEIKLYVNNCYIKTTISVFTLSLVFLVLTLIFLISYNTLKVFYVPLLIVVLFDVLYLLIVLLNKKKRIKKEIQNNKHYQYEYDDNMFTVKVGFENKTFYFYQLSYYEYKNFIVIEDKDKYKYIIPKNRIDKKELKYLRKHFI